MKHQFQVWLPIRFPGLTEIISSSKDHPMKYSAMKKSYTDICAAEFRLKSPAKNLAAVFLTFHWIEPNRKRDPDNIAAAKKFIIDGMVRAEIIGNDGWKHVYGFTDRWSMADKPGVMVTVEEV